MAPRNDMTVTIGAEGNLIDVLSRAQTQVKQFDNQVKRSGSVVQAYGAQHSEMTKKFKFFRGAAQQLGFQIGDYAVQVANGTSKMQAFGQQGAQMLGVFGPIGALLGAGVAIFSAIAVAAEKSAAGTDKATEAFQRLSNAFDDLESVDVEAITKGMTQPASKAIEKYSALLDLIRSVAEEQRASALAQTLEKISPADQMEKLAARAREAGRIVSELTKQGITTGAQYQRASELQESLSRELFAELVTRKTILSIQGKTRQEAAESLTSAIQSIESSGLMTQELRRQLKTFAEQQGLIGAMRDEISDAAAQYKKLGTTVLSAAEAQLMLNKGILPPQAAADLVNLEAGYRRVKKEISAAADEAVRLGKTTLSAVEARYMLNRGILPPGAEEDFKKTDAAYDAIRARIEANSKAVKSMGGAIKEVTASVAPELDPIASRMQQIGNTIANSFGNAFMSLVDGTMTAKEAFKSMAASIIKELYQIFVVKKITGFISGLFNAGQVSGPAMPLGTGLVRPVARPPGLYTGGTATGMRPHIVGEKGPELFIPGRTGQVVANDKIGGGGVTVIQNNTFGAGVSRAEINAMMPKMIETTKAAVFDAQRRSVGGRGYA